MAAGDLRLVYAEAAELLGVGRSTAYELVAQGELATVRLGRRVVVTSPTLTALLGVEPPLPRELDAARQALTAEPTHAPKPAATRRRRPVSTDTYLPFTPEAKAMHLTTTYPTPPPKATDGWLTSTTSETATSHPRSPVRETRPSEIGFRSDSGST